MNTELMFSTKTDMWATPISFFNRIAEMFNFDVDVCASECNAKCGVYYTEAQNGLEQEWYGTCWMNPPYGRSIGAWVKKAYESSKSNKATVVCLLPARTDTKWWHDYCLKGDIILIRGRLKFGDSKTSAPFPSALVVFSPEESTRSYKSMRV